uniref:Uncharacterized protein n=1 Tax=Phaeomonas parva TaxID=124430 RepID=A0A7S1TUQ3_9STRA|mmetsp:Transcript_18813/g.57159  ORF Transcript_18813/g.57159 Transcript_18813/m.57159 type:complete len:101 (+) Transcript_18813:133-435(+)|eukprot:CAMPEP_0118855156 /NCGR_PEP_ID=MMETSP1163-20130328/3093_1 /TAXON_ID=124430 /ORGANISM="Phaeomonas parva, Strain CCMP2877" /LENGTH=100 /DNA_ID=CAMNT_0006787997 /DNA_START=101 /DNA_END=403 /DNA_ORIENTATION=-
MATRGAFRMTSRVMAGARPDVNPNLVKWWKKFVPTDGEVIRHLSPYETNVVGNWMKTWPENITKRVTRYAFEGGPALLALVATCWWSEDYYHRQQLHHRD